MIFATTSSATLIRRRENLFDDREAAQRHLDACKRRLENCVSDDQKNEFLSEAYYWQNKVEVYGREILAVSKEIHARRIALNL